MSPALISRSGVVLALLLCSCAYTTHVLAQDTIQVTANAEERRFLAEAEALLASNQGKAAYTLLITREVELAGNPYFDYLLGVAALDSGEHSNAIFSLRRSLAVAPEFSGARLELARAYFESGNSALARPLFVHLLDESPPPGVRTVIDTYIEIIDARPATPKSNFRRYLEFTSGYDNNANGSTENQQFLGFTLSPDNLKTESSFAEIGAGFNWDNPKSTQFAWFAGGRASYRHNPDASFVDSGVLSGLAGMNWQRGSLFGRAGVTAYWATRDGEPNQSYAGLDALLGGRVAENWSLTLGIRGGALRHDDAIEILDVDRFLYTGGLSYRFASLGSFGVEILGGNDSERVAGSPYGNSKSGARLTLSAPVGKSAQLFASTGSLTSEYDGLFFGASREDTQSTTILQIKFRDVWSQGLSLTPRIRYVDNDSNVALYDYDRTEIGLLIRWMPQ
jgi:tetratricopeptide (TPR) repeat protein